MFKKLFAAIALLASMTSVSFAANWNVLINQAEIHSRNNSWADFIFDSTDSAPSGFLIDSKLKNLTVVNQSDAEIVVSVKIDEYGLDSCPPSKLGTFAALNSVDTLILAPMSSQVLTFGYSGSSAIKEDRRFMMRFKKVFENGVRVTDTYEGDDDLKDHVSILVRAVK